jgi:hypothetical protein
MLRSEIEAILKKLEPEIEAAFRDAIRKIKNAAQLKAVVDAIQRNDIEGLMIALRLEPSIFGPLDLAIAQAFFSGGNNSMRRLPPIPDPISGGKVVIGFDARSLAAERWVKENSSTLIQGILNDQRQMIREVIAQRLEQGSGPRATALDLVGKINRANGNREGGFVGLTNQQAQWALNAEQQLKNLDKGYFEYELRDKRFDRTVAKAIREGKPLPKETIYGIISRYRANALRHRGEAIARTESITAFRAARHESFVQLVASGKVTDDMITRSWDATGDRRTRFQHATMEGKTVTGMSAPFIMPDQSMMMFPGDTSLGARGHQTINCRCMEKIKINYIDALNRSAR